MTKLAVMFLLLLSGYSWFQDRTDDAAIAALYAIICLLARIMGNQQAPAPVEPAEGT